MAELVIDKIEAWAIAMQLPAPIDFGSFAVRERNYVAVRIHTRDGLHADCLAQSRASPIDVVLLELIGPILRGTSALDIEARRADVARALTALELDGAIGRAWSLAEICLHDLRAQAVNWPLWRMLGGIPRQLPVLLVEGYARLNETDDEFSERLAQRVSQGFRALKIEAGHYGDQAQLLRRVSQFRKRAGTECKLILDFAWAWHDPVEKLGLLAALSEYEIDWVEDPFPRQLVTHYATLKKHGAVPLGCGDEATRAADIVALLDAQCIDVVRLDATTIGGVGVARRLSGLARARGLRVSFHERPEIHEHCAFGFESADYVEAFPVDQPFDCAHEILVNPVMSRVERGMLDCPTAPGTGIRLRDEVLANRSKRHFAVML